MAVQDENNQVRVLDHLRIAASAQFYLLRPMVGLAAKMLLFNSFISPDKNRRARGAHGIQDTPP
jgi:hypothetical protein